MTTFAATTNADAFSIMRSQAAASGVLLGTLSDVASVALTVANILGGGASAESLPAGNVTNGTFGSVSSDVGIYSFPSQVGIGVAGAASRGLLVGGTVSAAAASANAIRATSTLVAIANSDILTYFTAAPTFTPGAFTGVQARGYAVNAFSVAAFTSPADPLGVDIGIITGTGATNAFGVRVAPPTGATNNYLIAHTTPATFNVLGSGNVTMQALAATTGVFSSTLEVDGNAGIGGVSSASRVLRVVGTGTASAGVAYTIALSGTLVATANSDSLVGLTAVPTFTPGSFTAVKAYGLQVQGFSTAAFTSPGDPVSIDIQGITGTGATNALGIRVAPPTGASNNYLIAHTTPATFNVAAAGDITTATTVTAGGLITGGASIDLTGAPGTAAASHVRVGGVTRTTIGANGAATALTANPLGYLDINVAGTIAQIPYYNRGA